MNPPSTEPAETEAHDARFHATSYLKFLRLAIRLATEGNKLFYIWMFVLTCIALVGAHRVIARRRCGRTGPWCTSRTPWC